MNSSESRALRGREWARAKLFLSEAALEVGAEAVRLEAEGYYL